MKGTNVKVLTANVNAADSGELVLVKAADLPCLKVDTEDRPDISPIGHICCKIDDPWLFGVEVKVIGTAGDLDDTLSMRRKVIDEVLLVLGVTANLEASSHVFVLRSKR